ncbi:MAG: hypothetical protein HY360_14245 [Verrucomicrobia bacterium]|nr:hypothetical protein [Verrucomicrobiota bacterium]
MEPPRRTNPLNDKSAQRQAFAARAFWKAILLALALGVTGCSIQKFAADKLGDALANGGATFASDDDPDLIRDASPFSLKFMESLLAETPQHRGLLLAACRGFTQYGYAFVQEDADETEARDLTAARALQARARRLYLRARGYGLRGLEVDHPGFEKALRDQPKTAAAQASVKEVPLLYWTAASWGAAIAVSKDNPELIADQLIVEAMMDRALELDEAFDHGAIHVFMISYESARRGAAGDPADRAKKHFDRAMELTGGQLASPLTAFAEAACVSKQKRAEFESLLNQALAINPDAKPEWRLANMVAHRRARWLLSRVDELFVE